MSPADKMAQMHAIVASDKAAGRETYPPGGGIIGRWANLHLAGADRLAHLSIEVDPATPEKVSKYIAVVYVEPNVGARYVRGESLWSFDEAIARAAGLLEPGDVPVAKEG